MPARARRLRLVPETVFGMYTSFQHRRCMEFACAPALRLSVSEINRSRHTAPHIALLPSCVPDAEQLMTQTGAVVSSVPITVACKGARHAEEGFQSCRAVSICPPNRSTDFCLGKPG